MTFSLDLIEKKLLRCEINFTTTKNAAKIDIIALKSHNFHKLLLSVESSFNVKVEYM